MLKSLRLELRLIQNFLCAWFSPPFQFHSLIDGGCRAVMDLSLPVEGKPVPFHLHWHSSTVAILVPGSLHTEVSKSPFLKSSLEEATWAKGNTIWPIWCYSYLPRTATVPQLSNLRTTRLEKSEEVLVTAVFSLCFSFCNKHKFALAQYVAYVSSDISDLYLDLLQSSLSNFPIERILS